MRLKKEYRLTVTLVALTAWAFLIAIAIVSNQPLTAVEAITLVLSAFAAVLLGLVLINLALVTIHEFGHYFAGRLVRMQFRYMQIGAFGVSSTSAGKTINRVAPWFSMNGLCAMTPADGEYRTGRIAAHILGGPIASAAALAALLAIDRLTGVRILVDWAHAPFVTAMLWLTTLIAGGMVAVSAVPFKYRGMQNDALLLLTLTRRKMAGKVVRIYAIDAAIRSHQRARDWGSSLLEDAIKDAESQHERLVANLLAFYAYWDSGDRVKAMDRIGSAAKECKSPIVIEQNRKLVLMEYAFAVAFHDRDASAAQAALENADEVDSGPLPWVWHRASAALALARGEYALAVEEAKMAGAALIKKVKTVTTNIQAEIEWNEEIIAAAKELMPPLRG